MEKIRNYRATPINDNWFILPNGVKIELKQLKDWQLSDDSV